MFRKISCLLAAVALAQPAAADVIYTWHQTAASPTMPEALNIELVFSDAAVAGGALALDIDNQCMFVDPCIDPQDSLLSLRYWYDGFGGERINYIEYEHRSHPRYFFDRISLDLAFMPGGMLSGSIFAIDGNSDFSLQSQGRMFTMMAAHSDEYVGCGWEYPECGGARGMLRARRGPQEVPEPPVLALGALAALGAWAARRRRA
ncbi:hypothetical protein [Massilia niastensis]|uniref:hypothetical protein n=1 Tax=Massilia niastensis TaxID=544911 RepID=UPI00035D4D98|nr:hypothetical protein [Massilia niastensis]